MSELLHNDLLTVREITDSPLELEESPCPLCGRSPEGKPDFVISEPLFRLEDGFHRTPPLGYRVCTNDGLIYMSPRLSKESLDYYYEHSPQQLRPTSPERIKQRIQFIGKSIDWPSKKILDVGCNTGDFLAKLKERGHDVMGVEPSGASLEYLSRKHPDLPVRGESLEDALPALSSHSFGLISLIHVLEHLVNPRKILNALESLQPDYLFVEVPDGSGSLYPRILKEHGHLAYYQPSHLKYLLEENGFQTIDVGTHGSSIQLIAERRSSSNSAKSPVFGDELGNKSHDQLETVRSKQKQFEQIKSERVDTWIDKIHEEELTAALFGAGTEAVRLLGELEPIHDRITGIMDGNPYFQGKSLLNRFPVFPARHDHFSNVDVVIVSLRGQMDSIQQEIRGNVPDNVEFWGLPR